jgi:D-serine deaminase-like pyridoxal phosphate-dependent protein
VTEAELETPALVVDLDRVERNLERWQRYADEAGLASRPHVKTHKSVELARLQLAYGARGVTCQKLGEAEVMVKAGIDDVLVPYNLMGESKLRRLAGLLARARVAVSVDDAALLRGLAGAARDAGRELEVLVECDTGFGRAGVQTPAAAAALGQTIGATSGLVFAGLLSYPSPPGARAFLEEALEVADLERPWVSTGGTPTMWNAAELRPVVTEYRVGTYVYNDRNTIAAGVASVDDCALTVLTTVVSRPTGDRAILDSGSKALAADQTAAGGHGLILEAQASTIAKLSEEHGHVELAPGERLELGDRVHVVPNHACVVSNLFDELWVTRGGEVVDRWAIDARGRSQ